jgi:hypothetical protein
LTLLDTGAEISVIDPVLALELRLVEAPVALPERPRWGDGGAGHCHGAYLFTWEATDSHGVHRRVEQIAYAIDHIGPPLIFGTPALSKQGIVLDTVTGGWYYRDTSSAAVISMITADACAEEAKSSPYIFVILETFPDELEELSKSVSSTLPPEFEDLRDVFNDAAAATQLRHESAEHPIETTGPPPHGPIYPLGVRELEVLKLYLSEAKAKGWIRESVSPAGAPILFVPKPDGSLRLCVDYRGLNKVTVKNRHPLPLVTEILDRLQGQAIYTKLDLKDAYHRVRIKESDVWKTAFRTRYGHFEYLVMPFGLANAPATFQAYINKALGDLVDTICVVYLDDIMIYSKTRAEHVLHVREVLVRLKSFGLFCNLKKCKFFVTEVDFLGFVISTDGVSMDPRKVRTITSWPRPKSFHDLMSFLGFCNFYRRFIDGYSKVSHPLTSLLKGSNSGKKEGPFWWPDEAEKAFRQLVEAFTTAPVLMHFDPRRRIRVETDASAFAVAGILSQLNNANGWWHPVAYWSRKLIDAERNYETHDQELLAIVAAFKHWRHYLEGAEYPIEVLTDHQNLKGFMNVKQLNGRQARWAMFLSAFDFVITHRAGKLNPADAPSRRSDYKDSEIAANQMLPTLFQKLAIEPGKGDTVVSALLAGSKAALRMRPGTGLRRRIPDGQNAQGSRMFDASEPLAVRADVVCALQTEGPYNGEVMTTRDLVKNAQEASGEARALGKRIADGQMNKNWTDRDGIIRFKNRLFVPPTQAIRDELLRRHHDDPYAGHFGTARTAELLRRKYHWQSMDSDVAEYVRSCDICQKTKVKRHIPYGKMEALPSPRAPWKEIALDFMSGVPPSMRGGVAYDAILVVVCRFSKMALYFPVKKTITAPQLIDLLIDCVFTRFGFPDGIVSDRDPRFTSEFWSEVCFYAKVKRRLSTAFHPQTDGQTERQNQTIQEYLRAFCSEHQSEWAKRLPVAEFAYNNSHRADLGISPFFAVLGYNPSMQFDAGDSTFEGEVPAAKERIQRIHELRKTLRKRLEDASKAQATYYNERHKPMKFSKNDLVLVSTKNLRLRSASRKMSQRMMGPFRIDEPVGSQAYRIHLPAKSKIHNVFHVSLLEPYHRREGAQESLPPPELIECEEEWEVEEILAKRMRQGSLWYKVRWKDWGAEYDQWIPEGDMTHAKELVDAFKNKAKSK